MLLLACSLVIVEVHRRQGPLCCRWGLEASTDDSCSAIPAARFGRSEQLMSPSAVLVATAKRAAATGGDVCAGRPRTVVSMTTFFGRMQSTAQVIDSILEQSCRPDAIYVFVSLVPRIDRDFRRNHSRALPRNLTAVAEPLRRSPIVDVRFITSPADDYGPATKLLAALHLERDGETHLVTVDDDTLYHTDMILALSLAARNAPTPVAVGFACEEYGFTPRDGNVVVHARIRRRCSGEAVEGTCHGWLDGVSGVLFQRSYIPDSIFNYSAHPKECVLHDDVWFAGMVPYLITPGFKSRTVRYIEADGANRPHSSSFFQTQKLRAKGIDPVQICASSFPALTRIR
ncbi:hypothetical protein M885DRAFT_441836 [Pelagophyceae sp. CCMP2097]|nr:hypothetical protein M885DRAFT_441836 [Pelagophyceae sp. CCMP2097]